MQRRQFVGGMALAGVALGGPSNAEAARPIPEPEVDAFLQELDRDLARVARTRGPKPLRRFLAAQGLRPGIFGETFATLQVASEWRESSEAVQRHPGFRRRLADRATRLGPDLCAVIEALTKLPRRTRERAGRLLRRPNRSMCLLDGGYFQKSLPMLKRRRGYLRHTAGIAARRVRAEAPGALIDELVAELDRVCDAAGTTRHELARVDATTLAAAPELPWAAGVDEAQHPEVPQTEQATRSEAHSSINFWKVGLILLGLAPVSFLAGVLSWSTVLCVLAPILLVASLVMFIVAAVLAIRERSTVVLTNTGTDRFERRLVPLIDQAGPLPA